MDTLNYQVVSRKGARFKSISGRDKAKKEKREISFDANLKTAMELIYFKMNGDKN